MNRRLRRPESTLFDPRRYVRDIGFRQGIISLGHAVVLVIEKDALQRRLSSGYAETIAGPDFPPREAPLGRLRVDHRGFVLAEWQL